MYFLAAKDRVTAQDNHNFFNAIFRFTRWSPSGDFEKILAVLCDEEELAMALMDSTALSAHQHAAELKKAYRMRA